MTVTPLVDNMDLAWGAAVKGIHVIAHVVALYVITYYAYHGVRYALRRLRRATPNPVRRAQEAWDAGEEQFVWFIRMEQWDEEEEERKFDAVESMGWDLVAAQSFGRGGGVERTFARRY